jgi:hypothetical protein
VRLAKDQTQSEGQGNEWSQQGMHNWVHLPPSKIRRVNLHCSVSCSLTASVTPPCRINPCDYRTCEAYLKTTLSRPHNVAGQGLLFNIISIA